MLHEVRRDTRATEDSDWPAPLLPTAPAARRRISATLVLLALMGLVALVVSFLAG
jgi:hypothetical protein